MTNQDLKNETNDMSFIKEIRNNTCVWYPSAGDDFRDLMFLSGSYPNIDVSADLFIHTDCDPFRVFTKNSLDEKKELTLYKDDRTHISMYNINYQHFSPKTKNMFSHFSSYSDISFVASGNIKIESEILGTINKKLIYIGCENEWFVANALIPNKLKIDYICHVRYGGGFGGANNDGQWLLKTLKTLNCKYYFSDKNIDELYESDKDVFNAYPQINGESSVLKEITVIPSHSWSDSGDVTLYEVQ